MELPHSENTSLSSTQQMIMYENFHVRGYVLNEEMYVNIVPRIEESSSQGHSNHSVSEQRRVWCPVSCTLRCPALNKVRCQNRVPVLCLAALCMLLLVVIAMLSIINGHLRTTCANQSAVLVLSYTSAHLQLHNSS
ncbi:hypothetical protein QTP86_033509, partial [Hemibagrus guttatus]